METKELKPVAKRFRRLRRRAMITQMELGQLIGLCRVAISRIECGHAAPRAKTLRRFMVLELKHDQPPIRTPARW